MSAIAGIFYRDDKLVERSNVEKMMAKMIHRGSDGEGVWIDGHVGLAHRRLDTTLESSRESQPVVLSSSGLTISADARIDNREAVWSQLSPRLKTTSLAATGDAMLIMMAYEKWGEYCVEQLLGDFAFVIWDAINYRLFCAVDHAGVRPFCYFLNKQSFVFASEISGLLAIKNMPVALDRVRVASLFIDSIFEIDEDSTLFAEIKYLPASYCMVVDGRQMRLRQYWNPQDVQPISLMTDEEYAEAFGLIFEESVKCRLRATGPTALALSGGIDSASVAAMSKLLLQEDNSYQHTFSAVSPDGVDCEETAHVSSSIAVLDGQSDSFTSEVLQTLKQVLLQALDNCHHPLGIFDIFLLCLYRYVSANGQRVMLDGSEGDTVLSTGSSYIAYMIRRLRFHAAYNEAVKYSAHTYNGEWPVTKILTGALRSAAIPAQFRKQVFWLRLWFNNASEMSALPLRRDFMRDLDFHSIIMQARSKMGFGLASSARDQHAALFSRPFMSRMYKGLDMLSSQFSLELRHPYLDRRVVEFSLGIPVEQKNRDGWEKWILRNLQLEGVSEKVRWKRGRSHVGWQFFIRFKELIDDEIDAAILDKSSPIYDYIDYLKMQQRYQAIRHSTDMEDVACLLQFYGIYTWLMRVS